MKKAKSKSASYTPKPSNKKIGTYSTKTAAIKRLMQVSKLK